MDRKGGYISVEERECVYGRGAILIGQYPGILEASVYWVLVMGPVGRAGCAAVDLEPLEREKSIGQIWRVR